MPVPMTALVKLVRLGRDFEKAYHSRQSEKVRSVGREIDALAERYPEEWLTPIVCRGQNIYRKAHGMEEVYPMD